MKHFLGSLFAIGLAGVAAIAATTAFLNAPLNIGAQTSTPATNAPAAETPPTGSADKTAAPEGDAKPAPPAGSADTKAPTAGAPGTADKPAGDADKPEEDDKDPYEGIAPEELPPDLQYDADSSVSFPTNI
jgi:hypothetical protein